MTTVYPNIFSPKAWEVVAAKTPKLSKARAVLLGISRVSRRRAMSALKEKVVIVVLQCQIFNRRQQALTKAQYGKNINHPYRYREQAMVILREGVHGR